MRMRITSFEIQKFRNSFGMTRSEILAEACLLNLHANLHFSRASGIKSIGSSHQRHVIFFFLLFSLRFVNSRLGMCVSEYTLVSNERSLIQKESDLRESCSLD